MSELNGMGCNEFADMAAELALGVLTGRERAEAIAHLDGCEACRENVRQLTVTGEELLGLRPVREPSAGFETRVMERLDVAPRTAVIRLDILRSVDRVPVSAATTWLPADRAPDAGRIYRDTRSLTHTLAQLGVDDFRRQSTRISAAIADAADAARLRLAPGRPLIVVDSTDVTADGRPILTTRARLAADRIELVIET